jgi:hypothetical protein
MALATAGVAYSIRANTAGRPATGIPGRTDRDHPGRALSRVRHRHWIGSPLLDVIGMRVLLPLSPILLSAGMFMMAFAGNIYRALVGSIWLRDRTCYGKGGFKPTKIQLFWINSGCIIPIDST